MIWNRTLTLRPDGRISRIRQDNEYGSCTDVYRYDAKGNITKIIGQSEMGNNAVTLKYDSGRDSHGNWLKNKKDDGSVIVREIEYYG